MPKYKGNYGRGELVRVDAYTNFLGRVIKRTGDFEYQIKDIESGLTDKNFDYDECCLSSPTIPERIQHSCSEDK